MAGVRVSGSFGSLETLHKGRLFIILSTSVRRVTITSRDGTMESDEIDSRIRRQGLMRDSNTPPRWEASAGLKCQVTPHGLTAALSSSWSHSWTHCLISLDAPVKLVPLSEYISRGSPWQAQNRIRALIKEELVIFSTSSRCTARVLRQVKMTP